MSTALDILPATVEEMMARLPVRLRTKGWTTADVVAMTSGVAEFSQLINPNARLRLCTAAGYFGRTLLVKSPKQDEPPVFRIVPDDKIEIKPRWPFKDISQKYVLAFLRVSAAYMTTVNHGAPFKFTPADASSIKTATGSRTISADTPWLVTTEAGAVYVYGAKKDDAPQAARDGVLAFFENPTVLDKLKR